MPLRFSQVPGRRERHLLRRRNNPLFPQSTRTITPAQLDEAQRLDHEEIVAFIPRFRQLVLRAARLQPNEGSEVILEIKEQLDQCYEEACGLADDQSETKQAIVKLLAVIMGAVHKGAGNDAAALAELEQEETARRAHFELLEYPLVADILYPDAPIQPEELAPALLSASPEELEAVLQVFDGEQLATLHADGERLLAACGDDAPHSARLALQKIAERLEAGGDGVES